MSVDVLGDFLTIIRNGVRASKQKVVAPYSKLKEKIAQILKNEGFIRDFSVIEQEGKTYLSLTLKYVEGESAIHEITRISTPGRRSYSGAKAIKSVIGGLGVSILTTSDGVMTQKDARQQNVGGEIICTVW